MRTPGLGLWLNLTHLTQLPLVFTYAEELSWATWMVHDINRHVCNPSLTHPTAIGQWLCSVAEESETWFQLLRFQYQSLLGGQASKRKWPHPRKSDLQCLLEDVTLAWAPVLALAAPLSIQLSANLARKYKLDQEIPGSWFWTGLALVTVTYRWKTFSVSSFQINLWTKKRNENYG